MKTAASLLFMATAVLSTGIALGQAQFLPIPGAYYAGDVTADGTVVVGGGAGGAYYWRWQEDPAPVFIGGVSAVGVSNDGNVITGQMIDPQSGGEVAGRWTEATGWVSLGFLGSCDSSTSSAYDISGDGSTIIGLTWENCSGRGFVWTEATGMLQLQNLVNGNNRATTISDDGSAIAGFAQGSFNRTPAYWDPDTSGMVLNPDFVGEVYGFSNDGVYSVGTLQGDAFIRTEEDGITNLGSLNSNLSGSATDISEDANTISGYDSSGFAVEAWIWTAADGTQSLQDLLIALGAGAVPSLNAATALSDDGNIVVGQNLDPFNPLAFVAAIDGVLGTWTDLGNGLAGAQGLPSLAGEGTLIGDTNTTLELNNGLPFGTAALVLGLSQLNAAFKQGVMVPTPDVIIPGLPLDGAGSLSIQFAWSTGLPSQVSLYWQYWIIDPAGPVGFSASNGLQSTTP